MRTWQTWSGPRLTGTRSDNDRHDSELQQLGYEAAVVEGRLRLTWRGLTPPIPAQVEPLLEALRRQKSAVLAALRCPWCEAAYAWATPIGARISVDSP